MRPILITSRRLQLQPLRPWKLSPSVQIISPQATATTITTATFFSSSVSSSSSSSSSSSFISQWKTQHIDRDEHHLRRRYASTDGDGTVSGNKAFDRNLKLLQRNNAARARRAWRRKAAKIQPSIDDAPVDYEYFRHEMALRLVDRLDDIRRDEGFPLALEIGAGAGHVYRAICSDDGFEVDDDDDDDDEGEGKDRDNEDTGPAVGSGGIGGVRKMVLLDSSDGMLHVDDKVVDDDDDGIPVEGSHRCEAYKLVADEESKLPFPDGTFDIVLSSQALHWINDLPQLFQEVHRVLKPDGCFMFSMIGGATLPELRISLSLAELERDGGVGAHVGPFVELSDVGSLMQNAGFALPTIDVDTVKISYPNAAVLMEHLQRMGEANASLRRRQDYTGKDVFLAAACIYDELYPVVEDDGNGGGGESGTTSHDVEASVQVIFAIGWTPHASQQKPSKRGSATHRVGEMVTETKAEKVQ